MDPPPAAPAATPRPQARQEEGGVIFSFFSRHVLFIRFLLDVAVMASMWFCIPLWKEVLGLSLCAAAAAAEAVAVHGSAQGSAAPAQVAVATPVPTALVADVAAFGQSGSFASKFAEGHEDVVVAAAAKAQTAAKAAQAAMLKAQIVCVAGFLAYQLMRIIDVWLGRRRDRECEERVREEVRTGVLKLFDRIGRELKEWKQLRGEKDEDDETEDEDGEDEDQEEDEDEDDADEDDEEEEDEDDVEEEEDEDEDEGDDEEEDEDEEEEEEEEGWDSEADSDNDNNSDTSSDSGYESEVSDEDGEGLVEGQQAD
ncbi:hypothetical protein B0T20DRAFT_484462 [Sordaria brevicollis]|uniref:Uncharacterized protein n=1 Tax=Sordaria brevicollis TaxID=83679 RepID=A0AAE0NVK5_SORBR|nr:hypothetical protein B0T20DRAFT_484462 [Sordaria brevicollis]